MVVVVDRAAQVSELTERPQALNTSSTVCNYTRDLLKRWATERPWLKQEETDELAKLVDEVRCLLACLLTCRRPVCLAVRSPCVVLLRARLASRCPLSVPSVHSSLPVATRR